jgi:hypothetical protein
LYAWAATTSKRVTSSGSQLSACDASTTVSAPCWPAAAAMSSSAATAPLEDWTALKATTPVDASIVSASRSSGTNETRTPRASCARNGKISEVNSFSAATTRVPSGSAAATIPSSPETLAPIATSSTRAPVIKANCSRARWVAGTQPSKLVRPPCQSASAACSASQAGLGGSP